MDILLHPSSTETISGSSGAFPTGNMALVGLFVNVTNVVGFTTLSVKLQQSPDGIVWYDVQNISVGSITSVSSNSLAPAALVLLCDYCQCVWTITNGDKNTNFTFTVDLITQPA